MNRKIIWLLIIMVAKLTMVNSQSIKFDTIIICNSTYGTFNFKLGNAEMQYFVVTETNIDIKDGEIEKNKQSSDTIGIKNIGGNLKIEHYEIELSDDNWTKILFGRQCDYLSEEIDSYPILRISRNKFTNKLSFLDPEMVGKFIKSNYEKKIECIESSDDKFMKKHLIRWIDMIDSDSIHQFSTSLTSHFYHVFSLYDLIVPTNHQDTLLCKISKPDNVDSLEFIYQSSRRINPDSSIIIHFTDNVQGTTPLTNKFTENLYRIFEEVLSKEERNTNEIRLKSMKNVDKFDVKLNKNGEFERYIRTMESFMLDSELKPKLSFYNYEIEKREKMK